MHTYGFFLSLGVHTYGFLVSRSAYVHVCANSLGVFSCLLCMFLVICRLWGARLESASYKNVMFAREGMIHRVRNTNFLLNKERFFKNKCGLSKYDFK